MNKEAITAISAEQLLEEEADRLGLNQENLAALSQGALKRWEKEAVGNGCFSSEDLEAFQTLVNAGGVYEAIVFLAVKRAASGVPASAKRAVNKARKEAAALFSKDQVLVKGPGSRAFALGSEAHANARNLWTSLWEEAVAGGDLGGLSEIPVNLDEGEARRIIFKEAEKRVVVQEPLSKEEVVEEETAPSRRKIVVELSESLPPLEGQSLSHWALNIFEESLETIRAEMGGLPEKPYAVAELMRCKPAVRAMLRLSGAAVAFFGPKGAGSLLTKKENDGVFLLDGESLTELAILNWLALARMTLEVANNGYSFGKETGILAEMPLGDLKFSLPGQEEGQLAIEVAIKGGKIDLGVFLLPGEQSPTLDKATQHARGEFNSQKGRNRRPVVAEGSEPVRQPSFLELPLMPRSLEQPEDQPEVEYYMVPVEWSTLEGESKTRLGRNLRSYFIVLWHLYGDVIFEKLSFVIKDWKFLGGDGGWFFAVNPEDLPDQRHVRQMGQYLFWAISDLYWVYYWSRGQGEDFAISLEEIVAFADYLDPEKPDSRRLCERVRGEICYQLPDKEEQRIVSIGGRKELQQLGEQVLGEVQKMLVDQLRLELIRTLMMIKGQKELRVVKREALLPPLPERAGDWLVQLEGRNYLAIDMLAVWLFAEQTKGLATVEAKRISRAVFYEKEGVFVLWVDNLLKEAEKVRVAINQKGSFAVHGLGSDLIRGSLSSRREMTGVKEECEGLLNAFLVSVWQRLPELGAVHLETQRGVIEGKVLCFDGELKKPVEGKPTLCLPNPMTGAWEVIPELLKEAAESWAGRDTHGLQGLAEAIQRRKDASLFCPSPFHENTDTKAGYLTAAGEGSCFSPECRIHWGIKGRRRPRLGIIMADAERPNGYTPVSGGRRRTFQRAFEIGKALSRHSPEAASYLAGRGLDPGSEFGGQEADLPDAFFVPRKFSGPLADLARSKAVGALRKRKEGGRLRLDQLEGSLNLYKGKLEDKEVALVATRAALKYLEENLPREAREQIVRQLTLAQLQAMRRRGIIGRSAQGWDRWGGRLWTSGYWLEEKRGEYVLALSNHSGRGIQWPGEEPLFDGDPKRKYIKAFVAHSGRAEREGKTVDLYKTPAGVWLPRPEAFLATVGDLVLVFEGQFNQASFGRMNPDLRNECLTMLGSGWRQLIAFLHWLGVKGDNVVVPGSPGKQIKEVCLAYDFDAGGVKAFRDVRIQLQRAFPEVLVTSIHRYLPTEVELALPSLFRGAMPEYKEEIFKKGSYWKKHGLDLNDLLLREGIREEYAFQANFSHGAAQFSLF